MDRVEAEIMKRNAAIDAKVKAATAAADAVLNPPVRRRARATHVLPFARHAHGRRRHRTRAAQGAFAHRC